eukprot:SAG31_NODE_31059_length_372_cov_3.054945_1_plen_67_part_10
MEHGRGGAPPLEPPVRPCWRAPRLTHGLTESAPAAAAAAAPTTKEAGTAGSMEKDEVIELVEEMDTQ